MKSLVTSGIRLPDDPKAALPLLLEALTQLQVAMDEIYISFYSISHVAPTRLKEGMIRQADGTDWNPGAGAGLYQYRSGSWARI
jgi:hypothetical protein